MSLRETILSFYTNSCIENKKDIPINMNERILAVKTKIEDLRRLSEQNVHFNERLYANRDFMNPSIYEKLIEYIDVREDVSNFIDPQVFFPKEAYYDKLCEKQKSDYEKRSEKIDGPN